MKLLKFVNSDAPHTLANVQLRNSRLTFPSKQGSAQTIKAWSIDTAPSSLQGGYWLLDDDNNPICEVTSVLLAMPESIGAPSASSSSVATPRGVSEKEMDGIDLGSKMGSEVEREGAR